MEYGPPKADQIEVSVFGPGYGESIAVHIGSNRWVLIDSCMSTGSRKVAVLDYFEKIGVDPAKRVDLVVATHWHDDHIRGLSELADACVNATFCMSAALTHDEFVANVIAHDDQPLVKGRRGPTEIRGVLDTMKRRQAAVVRASANTLLHHVDSQELAHGKECQVWALSPSGAQFQLALESLLRLVPGLRASKGKLADPGKNDLSIAAVIAIGEDHFLFGADLEETGDVLLGWSAIINLPRLPGPSRFFKIPHHGSRTAHHEETWSVLLERNPTSVLTPWNKGSKLPTSDDVERICDRTSQAFSTSKKLYKPKKNRPYVVDKMLREMGVKLEPTEYETGHVRYRNLAGATGGEWDVELADGACRLAEMYR